MVRTRADNCGRKAVGSKAPRKSIGSGASSSSSSNDSNAGCFGMVNHAKMWPTPTWQKGIGNFFQKAQQRENDEGASTLSKSSQESESITRQETEDVIVQSDLTGKALESKSTEIESSPEDANKENNLENKEDEDRSTLSKSRGKQKHKRSAPLSSNKKRRVVIEDSDDE